VLTSNADDSNDNGAWLCHLQWWCTAEWVEEMKQIDDLTIWGVLQHF